MPIDHVVRVKRVTIQLASHHCKHHRSTLTGPSKKTNLAVVAKAKDVVSRRKISRDLHKVKDSCTSFVAFACSIAVTARGLMVAAERLKGGFGIVVAA